MAEIAPSGGQYEIVSGDHRAVLVAVGGGLRTYELGGVNVVDGFAAEEMCPGSAGQVLAPWPNRIRDGKYVFDGQAEQLPLSEPALHNAIHGLTRWIVWSVADVAPDRVTFACEVAPQTGYPWALLLRTTWSVSSDGLRADHEAVNVGSSAAPFGLGTHPYLIIPDVAVDDLLLTLPAHSRMLTDGRLLPMGEAKVTGTAYDFVEGRRIGDAQLDDAFGDVERTPDGGIAASLTSPDGARVREVWADAAFSWWQVYTGDTLHGERLRRSVALEPMTCPPDAFRSGRDVITLDPGERWEGSWGIRAQES